MNEACQRLPGDLETMPVGAELAALLAPVDRQALSSQDRVRLLRARHRLVAHLQGELYADLHAVSGDEVRPWVAADTVATVLRWTPPVADAEVERARRLVEDLPAVQEALVAGDIDLPKALVILEVLETLELPLARQVAGTLVAEASGEGLLVRHDDPQCDVDDELWARQ